jgi:hypothetical protein
MTTKLTREGDMAATGTQTPPELARLLADLPETSGAAVGTYDYALLAAKVALQFFYGGQVVAARLTVGTSGDLVAGYQVVATGETNREVDAQLAALPEADRDELTIDYVERLDEESDALVGCGADAI